MGIMAQLKNRKDIIKAAERFRRVEKIEQKRIGKVKEEITKLEEERKRAETERKQKRKELIQRRQKLIQDRKKLEMKKMKRLEKERNDQSLSHILVSEKKNIKIL